jgi:phospholipase C
VYVGGQDGRLYAYNAAGCSRLDGVCSSPLWTSASSGSEIDATPVVADGLIYRASANGSLAAFGVPSPPSPPPRPSPETLTPLPTPIRHVVVLYQENHSFDNVFGYLCAVTLNGRCDGGTTGRLSDGSTIALSRSPDIIPAVGHGFEDQATAIDGGAMDHFDKIRGCTHTAGYRCFTQFQPDQIPALIDLATTFTIADRTFATYPSGTWGAHMALVSMTLDGFTGDFPTPSGDYPFLGSKGGPAWGCDSLKEAPWQSDPSAAIQSEPSCIPAGEGTGPYKPSSVSPGIPTLMDRLDGAGLSWRIYEGAQVFSNGSVWATCPTFGDCLFGTQSANMHPASQLRRDGSAGQLPNVSLVMPLPDGYSQHNGTSMIKGDDWISTAVQAIMNGPDWRSTVIFVTYDDCGCFYDHVSPPLGRGPRMPLVIISPYVMRGYTDSHDASVASIAAYIEHAFGLAPLTSLDGSAYDYSGAFAYSNPAFGGIELPVTPIPSSSIRRLARRPPSEYDPE